MMHLFSLLLSTVALSTIILGNPVAEGQLSSSSSSSLDNFFISPFLPQDLQSPPNLNQGIYADAPLGSQSSNGKTLQDFAILDQQIGPNLVFGMALAPNSQGEKIDDETAQYRSFNCNGKYSVCCEGRDRSINSQHMPCPEKIGNQYAGYEEVSSPSDMRYGQYCYKPFYAIACDESLWAVLQDTKGVTCYTNCQIPVVKPQEQGTTQELKDSAREGFMRDDSLRDFHWRRF